MVAKKKSPSLPVMASLKRAFKVRCQAHNIYMSEALVGLIDGWLRNEYQVVLPADPRPQNIYVPVDAWEKLRHACSPEGRNVPRRAVLEALITGWIEGRFVWPPRGVDE
ncbi:hypothetical protein LCGC14_0258290 [marine sediment metagenome]|uniref:Uncharacterized protein n=1 Tax=marine sediment metagenome TaxID=412755 RepID=A0A0F9U701_9ZZZZ